MMRHLLQTMIDALLSADADVAVPNLRSGAYFPEWLLERRKRAESALITVVADCYLAGVSTRCMDTLLKTLGIDGLSKSQVSRVAADALTMKVCKPGRVMNSVVLVATDVNGDGHREFLGLQVASVHAKTPWHLGVIVGPQDVRSNVEPKQQWSHPGLAGPRSEGGSGVKVWVVSRRGRNIAGVEWFGEGLAWGADRRI